MCRAGRDVVKGSTRLQYQISQFLTSTVDVPSIGRNHLRAERIASQRRWCEAWKTFKLTSSHVTTSTTPARCGYYASGAPSYHVSGSIVVHQTGQVFDAGRLDLRCLRLPSRTRGITMSEWVLRGLPEYCLFVCDYHQDLLVLCSMQ